MSFILSSKSSSGPKQLPQAGPQLARLVQIVDLGDQVGFQGQIQPRLLLTYELPEDLVQTGDHKGKPLVISQEFTKSIKPSSNLRKKFLNILMPQYSNDDEVTLDLETLLGLTLQVNIVHKPSQRDKSAVTPVIVSVSPLRKTDKVPEAVTPMFAVDLDTAPVDVFVKLPKWIQRKSHRTDITVENKTAAATGAANGDY